VHSDFFFEVAAGRVPGHSSINKTSHDTSITTTIGTIGHETGTLHVYSTSEDIDYISSDNAGDTHDITIDGLLIDGTQVYQTATLNGLAPVTLDTPLYRVNCIYNDISTTLTATLGTIYLWVSGGGDTAGVPDVLADVRSSIRKTGTISLERCVNSVYTVPKGKTGYIVFGKTTVSDAKAMELTFWAGIGQIAMSQVHHVDVKDNNYDYFFKTPARMPAGTDLEVRATVTSGTAQVAAHYDIVLVDD
jgi:hypothetical protein